MKKAVISSLTLIVTLTTLALYYNNRQHESVPETELPTYNNQELTQDQVQAKLNTLDPLSYHVLAENGTETPFRNEYWDNKEEGIYVDKVTGKPLFSSTHKFVSRTGWPSFWRPIDENSVTLHEDRSLGMVRTEVRSQGGHLGHLFNDGPPDKGGQRYCLNSAALIFVPKEKMEELGYGDYLYLFAQN